MTAFRRLSPWKSPVAYMILTVVLLPCCSCTTMTPNLDTRTQPPGYVERSNDMDAWLDGRDYEHERCLLPVPRSSCQAKIRRYRYNLIEGHCEMFTWGGCSEPEMENNFGTIYDCSRTCSMSPNSCKLAPNNGYKTLADVNKIPRQPRWYHMDGQCYQFIYEGVGGNLNNFPTYAKCMRSCSNLMKHDDGIKTTSAPVHKNTTTSHIPGSTSGPAAGIISTHHPAGPSTTTTTMPSSSHLMKKKKIIQPSNIARGTNKEPEEDQSDKEWSEDWKKDESSMANNNNNKKEESASDDNEDSGDSSDSSDR